MNKPELLSPAGDWESFVAAVQNGADAVYLGGRDFSARQQAANFDRNEMARAVEYAHVRGVKIYVTVNTLISDNEMEPAVNFLAFLYNTGVDAVIVQDLGLIKVAGQLVPGLELHASTQMTVHSCAAAKLLRDSGLKRIVLAREMGLDEIKEIKTQAGVEVEVFIHGALCVCYSGQCLMSSMIGGRSGNRGRCAQPCRLQYQLEGKDGRVLALPEKNGEYLLSPRDLNLSGRLPELIAAGIDSFKVEGRMKRPEYVATVTRIYRNAIDRSLAGNFYITAEEKNDLAQIFNRDFTTGYFFGHPGRDLMSYKRPNNRGVLLGRVKGYSRQNEMAEIRLDAPLQVGDGLEVWVSRGGRAGTRVHDILSVDGRGMEVAGAGDTVRLGITGDIHPGDRVFKTYDSLLAEKAKNTYTSERETKKIPVSFVVSAAIGEPFRIMVSDTEGFTGGAVSNIMGEPAQKRPLTKEFLFKQLDRLGNTPYSIQDLICHLSGDVMIPVREINNVRRKALEELSQKRSGVMKKGRLAASVYREHWKKFLEPPILNKLHQGNLPVLAVAVSELDALRSAVRAGASEVYFGGDGFRSKAKVTRAVIEEAAGFCHNHGARLILSTPRILHDSQYKMFLTLWEKAVSSSNGVMVSNLGFLGLAAEKGVPVYTDFTLNVFNSQSIAFLLDKKVQRITLSPELTMQQIKNIKYPAEVLVHGAMPLMVSRYCVLGGVLGNHNEKNICSRPCKDIAARLRDRKGITFPVEVDQYCCMHLFNSRELCLIDSLDELLNSSVTAIRIDARLHKPESIKIIVRLYGEALDRIANHSYTQDFGERAKRELARFAPQGFTKGHFYRGVV